MNVNLENSKRLLSAFPRNLSSDVSLALSHLPPTQFNFSEDNIGLITISEEQLFIPSRFYSPEPTNIFAPELNSNTSSILACIYTRHNDGFVRQKYVNKIFNLNHVWVAPFVLQLLGEYVIEIIEDISENIDYLPLDTYKEFIKENPPFVRLLKQRIISYWNCYFKSNSPKFENYIGFKVTRSLGLWEQSEIKNVCSPLFGYHL